MKNVISIIGFGYIGKVLSSFFLDKGYKILAVEVNKKTIQDFNKSVIDIEEPEVKEILNNNTDKIKLQEPIKKIELSKEIFVTVGTPLISNKPSMKFILDAANYICKYAPYNSNVILKSTVVPGTTDKLSNYFKKKLRKDINLVFSPERLAEGTALKDLRMNPIILSGPNKKKLNEIKNFWKKINVPTILFKEYKSAEICKLASNMWIDLNIALGNEIGLYCDTYKLDSKEIINAANTLKKGSSKINILSPSIGVGGYCLTKDPYFLKNDANKQGVYLKLPSVSRSINDNVTKKCMDIIFKNFSNHKTKETPRIMIFGLAFKNNTGDCRNTPIKKITNFCQRKKIFFDAYDPLVSDEDFNKITFNKNRKKLSQIKMDYYDIFIFGCAHKEFKRIKFKNFKNTKILFDGRRLFTKTQIRKLEKKNIIYSTI